MISGGGEDWPFVGGEALSAVFTFTAAAYASAGVVGGVKHLGIIILAIRAAHGILLKGGVVDIYPQMWGKWIFISYVWRL